MGVIMQMAELQEVTAVSHREVGRGLEELKDTITFGVVFFSLVVLTFLGMEEFIPKQKKLRVCSLCAGRELESNLVSCTCLDWRWRLYTISIQVSCFV